jgi:hypothetical protein
MISLPLEVPALGRLENLTIASVRFKGVSWEELP